MTRVYGAGTIEKRKDRAGVYYRVRFNLGTTIEIDPATGETVEKRKRSPWRYGGRNKDQAIKVLAKYRKELESGLDVEVEHMTFAQWADEFHQARVNQAILAPGSLRHEAGQIKLLNKYISNIRIRDITARTVSGLLASLGKEGKSANAQLRAYRQLSQILKAAVNEDVIMRNPCDKVKAPRADEPEIAYLDAEGIARLMAALDETRCEAEKLEQTPRTTKPRKKHEFETHKARAALLKSYVMTVWIALATGMRKGEILGLTIGRVDTVEAIVNVARQNTIDGIRKPKGRRTRRFAIDSYTASIIAQHITRQAEYLKTRGIKQDKETPVCASSTGSFIDPNNFTHWWRTLVKSAGIEGFRFHDLRHTNATALIAAGADVKTLQNHTGHASAKTLLDIYASFWPSKDREVAELMGDLLRSLGPPRDPKKQNRPQFDEGEIIKTSNLPAV